MNEERALLAQCYRELIACCRSLDDAQISILLEKWWLVRDMVEVTIRANDPKIKWITLG